MMAEPEALSERELEVLRLVAQGLTNDQIARELVISTNTVKVHLRNIFAKLGVASRTEASLYAVREGWVVLDTPASEPTAEAAEESPSTETTAEEVPASRTVVHPWSRWLVVASIAILLLSLGISLTNWPVRLFVPTAVPSPPTAAVEGWVERTPMPSPRSNLAVVAFQGTLYAIGGNGPAGASNKIERWNPADDTWTALASKPTAVANVQAAVVGGHIYVPGGHNPQGNLTQVVEVYLVESNQWATVASLPHPLSAYALVAFEGKLYLLGGWDGTQYRDEVLRYTPETDVWEVAGRLPYPCGSASAITAENRILLIGGINAEGPLDVILEYIPALSTMNPQPLADVPLGRTQSALFGDYLYVLADSENTSTPQIWRHNLRTEPWRVVNSPADGIMPGTGLAGLGNDILLVGGEQEGQPLSRILQLQAIFSAAPIPAFNP